MRLKGKVAVVTGGTRGLGARIAAAFVAEGCRVVCAGRTGTDDFHSVDVRDRAGVDGLMAATVDRFGALDILVANAGVARPGAVGTLSAEHWSEVIDTNLTGVFHSISAAVPHLEDGGRIITMSSALATRAVPMASAYCASKAAIESFTRVCALELADRGITVNCLAPGFIDEGMGRQLASAPVWRQYEPKLAAKRMGSADEVAAAAVFLASDDASYVNGHILEVNGGLRW